MDFSIIKTIIFKEIKDNIRDKRTVLFSAGSALLLPVLIIGILAAVSKKSRNEMEKVVDLPVIGAHYAPELMKHLQQSDIKVNAWDADKVPLDPHQEIANGTYDIILKIPEDFQKNLKTGKLSKVVIMSDASKSASNILAKRVAQNINQFGQTIASMRLRLLGVNPQSLQAIAIEMQDSSPGKAGGLSMLLSIIPFIILTVAFSGGFYLAVDTTGGEKERKTLEPLLQLNVPRSHFVYGKIAAVFLFALLVTLISSIILPMLLNSYWVSKLMGMHIKIGWDEFWIAFAVMTPAIFLASVLQFFIGSFTKSVKEAQTYIQILTFFGSFPSYFLAVFQVKSGTWSQYIPTVSQFFLASKIFRGDFYAAQEIVVSTGVTLAIAFFLINYCIKLYEKESIFAA